MEHSTFEIHYAEGCDVGWDECKERAKDDKIRELEKKVERLEKACRNAMNEIGVPHPGYPSPIKNAYDFLAKAALDGGDSKGEAGVSND